MHVDVAQAQRNLTKLIKAVERGEIVTVCRKGIPVVDMVAVKNYPTGQKRKLGALKGKIKIIDPDWWKPMS